MAGIYIHIPFCRQACHYCDFHFSTNLDRLDQLVAAIGKETEMRKDYLQGQTVETVYFGGGTPSLLAKNHLEYILDLIRKNYTSDFKEVTLEANPDDLSDENLKTWKSLEIDRLSLGIQSFQEHVLQFYNRAHTAKEAREAISKGRNAGFEKFSIDLIYGFPHPDHSIWKNDLSEAIRQDPGHISAYSLTVEPKTALGKWTEKGRFRPAEEDFVAEQFEWLQEQSEHAGYIQYEISNFGKPSNFALHNTNYWKGVPYLGLGPSAHSFNGKNRGFNPSSNPGYLKSLEAGKIPFQIEPSTPQDQVNDRILTGLRTIWGLSLSEISGEFGIDLAQSKAKEIEKLEKQGWLIWDGKILSLTKRGMLLADSIAAELFI
ncbi:radical SAM family heme chaperone HemW [Algoriphagus sp. A40]|uniref:radical SAM family heme chaperone HemW n=1 Tax=Algoriphagus sp. A40 TaxID=1945863 RepID=UPI0009856F8A|nr:radical SAM family heme chaperone HemW [Algoriphagus sp. A40]OOG69316.1 coproporphyrinogen III oxidase [Algoriphagus sp. A40]